MSRRFPIVAGIPYVTVLLGLHGLKSGLLAMLLYHAGMLAVLLLWGRPFLTMFKRGWRGRQAIWLTLVAIAAGPVVSAIWPRIGAPPLPETLASVGLEGLTWIIFISYFSTAHAYLEESFWRGYLHSDRRRIVWQDVLFAGYHVLVLIIYMPLAWVGLVFAVLVLLAWAWRLMTRVYGGLAIPIVTHAAGGLSLLIAVHGLSR